MDYFHTHAPPILETNEQPISSFPPFFFKVTLVWFSNAELNVFIDEFTIPFVANVSDAIRISVVFLNPWTDWS